MIGSHIDSVPNGGWLDGALGIMGALETLRIVAEAGTPPCTVKLVDWADEEGARFGRSLFGSSAACGTLDPEAVRDLRDAGGVRLEDAVAVNGVELDRRLAGGGGDSPTCGPISSCTSSRGPCSRASVLPIGTVLGTVGVERNRVIFRGQAAHAGSTPMTHRRDSFLAAARFALAVRDAAIRHGGVCTTGAADSQAGRRHRDRRRDGAAARPASPGRRTSLAALLAESKALSEEAATAEGCTVEWEPLWRIEPIPFDAELIAVARRGLPGGGGMRPRAALRPAARRRRDGAARADGDDLLLVDERHQPCQGGGHPDRAPRAGDPGLRADRRCGDRPGRGDERGAMKIIRGGTVVNASESVTADVLIDGETIVGVGAFDGIDAEVIDATGCFVLPGAIDNHTHLSMPFGGTWSSDDYDTGTQAAAAGGTTCIVDFALQMHPNGLRSSLEEWMGRAEGAAHVDYGFHMAITSADAATIADMAAIVGEGITSFKVFLAYPNVLMVTDDQFLAVLERARDLEALTMVHCENGFAIQHLVQKALGGR